METSPEPLQEQRSSTDNSITDITFTTQQSLVSDLQVAAIFTNSIINSDSSIESAQKTEDLLHNDTSAVTTAETTTPSNAFQRITVNNNAGVCAPRLQ